MKRVTIFSENIRWLHLHLKTAKWLYELLGLFFVAETFLYNTNFGDAQVFNIAILSAIKIIFWIFLLLVALIIYIKVDTEITDKEDNIFSSLFKNALFIRFFLRAVLWVLFITIALLLWQQLKINWRNGYLFFIWFTVGTLIFLEIIRFILNLINHERKINRR